MSAVLAKPSSEGVTQKVKGCVLVLAFPLTILAVHDLGLLRVKLKPAHLKAGSQLFQNAFGLSLTGTMHQTVSQPRELPPQLLSELYVNLSAHTAPIIQPKA